MPSQRKTRRGSLAVAAVASSLLLSPLVLGVTPAAAEPSPTSAKAAKPLTTSPTRRKLVSTKLTGGLATKRIGTQSVFVQLSGQGAADAAATSMGQGKSRFAARVVSQSRRSSVQKTTRAVVAKAKIEDANTEVLFSVSNAVPGVAISATTGALEALAARSDVVKISPLVPKKINNAGVDQLTKAVNSWQSPGVTGKGVKVGIIDTGIDYTHADFGGAGTTKAYAAAHATSAGTFTPTAKVVGGYDFVGDDYQANPTIVGYQPVPKPDRNPLDCEGHGTHVSGTAAGYGVTANGSTYKGSYATLTAKTLNAMKIGPGMAPQASLYGLKVFGCTGSTNAVLPALDWSLDPNGDGDFSDHLDIVNLSLGVDYGVADDPENAVIDNIAKHGVLPVTAAGNAGDLTDAGGSPGDAVRSVGVASSVDASQLRDGLKVLAPATVAGIAAGQMSTAYDWAGKPDVTGVVVRLPGANADGCTALAAEDTSIKGKVAWLEWDDNDATRACGSAARANNVAAAGAIGAIFTSGLDVFGAGITGSKLIPVVQLPKAETDRLRPAVTAGTLKVTFSGALKGTIKSITPAIADTLSNFSSRGTHGSPGVVKPDLTNVGDTVASAGVGTGNGVEVESGTSMATPATAGIAALVKKTHPSWTTEQLKAALMNTATHDLYTKPDHQGRRYGPARVGAGRVDALAAVTTQVLAYSTKKAGVVSTSFGVVEVPIDHATVTKSQYVRIRNTASKSVSVKVSYQGVVKQPGVAYTVSPTKVTIKARSSKKVRVTMTVTAKKLRRTIDPTMDTTQTDALLGVERARQYVSDASGRLLVTPSGKTALRVPVFGAAKPVSRTHVVDGKLKGGPAIVVRGNGVSQGSGSNAYQSKLSVMDLGFSSPKQPACAGVSGVGCASSASTRSADLQYVGAGATPSSSGSKANGWLYFGVSTFGNWATVGNSSIPFVDFDTTGDGEPDFEAYVQNEPSTDLLTSYLVDLNSGLLVDIEPVNFADGDVDTNVFDTDAIIIPVVPAAIGLKDTDKTFPISYSVGVFSASASALSGNVQDQTPSIAFDAAAPKVKVAGPLFADRARLAIPYSLPTSVTSTRALVLHLQGRSGARAEVQTLKGAGSTS